MRWVTNRPVSKAGEGVMGGMMDRYNNGKEGASY